MGLPYSTFRKTTGNLMFISGQLPIDEDGNMPEDVKTQTRIILNNIENIVKENGKTMDDIVKTTVFITDFSKFGEMNEEYALHFGENKPARSACEVTALAKNAKVEIEAIVQL